ncbi:MAG TPA: response regulator transcription factor, partial [Terriglobales bacterium]
MELGRILIVDDEPQILRVLRTSLGSVGYEVRAVENGVAALEAVHQWTPDLVITDLSMPKMNGAELCSAIREFSTVPIIVLSVRGEDRPKIDALDRGADDYVTKPFSIQELMARVRAHLRRNRHTDPEDESAIAIGDFLIDRTAHRVKMRGEEVRLTPKEFSLLVFMAQNPQRVLTHRVLLNALWGGQTNQQVEHLRVFINTLRKKIDPKYVVTEPWIG